MRTMIFGWQIGSHHKGPGLLWRLIISLLANGAALYVGARVIPGIDLEGWKAIVVVGLLFGAVNTVIKPLVSMVTCLLHVLTFGLFTVVVNAGMLYLTEWLADRWDLAFDIENFWSALLGAVVISITALILGIILRLVLRILGLGHRTA